MANLDDALHCPKCKQPGNPVASHNSTGAKGQPVVVHSVKCENERCRWYDTTWIVQVNPDGTVPERKAGEKEFPALLPGHSAMAQRMIEDLKGQDLRGDS